ncbi:ribosomal-processing cysteine protease Prp [Malacoplasma iowae]|uniref:Ribosomal processing cysteine protease Prp n=2 Tax=Malacoplasma iowae TaxID=2116 RepID=A0A084U3Y9_MALIO|nr:ribosomal-processing cysteine protease Prp [Malacoplasma iowae]VEU61578.1 putative ribosomal protein [Mycoplasmopsis fermentans]EGZ31316.1 hypothetical protein GUU_02593 [Malacoplasma iowae 695]KFB07675.1 putative ribosomal protein [Malacoplasma iowae DK-CPA]QHG89329.1 ribosomal-processing cysteine protease Prp [Malacoplasma iowae 695]QHG90262.1 ribosomal-processing cysteine protease Prp [Malacoplasma iowae 695]
MINIDFYKDGFQVRNHSNYDVHNRDIVCAGVSAVVLGSINWFQEKDILDIVVDNTIPIVKLKIKLNPKTIAGLGLIKNQLQEISRSYADYVSLIEHNENI